MFIKALIASLVLIATQAHAETGAIPVGSVFSALVSDNKALVGFYADRANNVVNFALCDYQNLELNNCELQSERGFVANDAGLDHLRFQFEYHINQAYTLVQLGSLPSATAPYEGLVNAYENSGKSDEELGAEVLERLNSTGGIYRPTLPLTDRESDILLSLTPEKIASTQQISVLNADEAPGLNLQVIARTLKLSLELM